MTDTVRRHGGRKGGEPVEEPRHRLGRGAAFRLHASRVEELALLILSRLERSERARGYIHGAGLAFDPEPYHRWDTFEKSDFRAFLSDWLAIVDDLRCSLERASDELTHGNEAEAEALAARAARRASGTRQQPARAE